MVLMRERIDAALAAVESDGPAILYACESGSRAWAIESPDSDWDVRFIYVQPLNWYLGLGEPRDVIEVADGLLDAAGWDLRKALRLAAKSNPALLEWLYSPIVYRDAPPLADELRAIMQDFSARALMHHYLNLAHAQVRAYFKVGAPVKFKKYLYAVRPLLALHFMDQHGHALPPVSMPELFAATVVPAEVRAEIDRLLILKREATERDGAGRLPVLDDWIASWLGRGHALANAARAGRPDMQALERLFRQMILRP